MAIEIKDMSVSVNVRPVPDGGEAINSGSDGQDAIDNCLSTAQEKINANNDVTALINELIDAALTKKRW
ncbi:MAG: hypothetical protein HRT37_17130 [Alteromonadaceae bacterium]|nr:hypothetical protein [Alteromonadaceae bacterium]